MGPLRGVSGPLRSGFADGASKAVRRGAGRGATRVPPQPSDRSSPSGGARLRSRVALRRGRGWTLRRFVPGPRGPADVRWPYVSSGFGGRFTARDREWTRKSSSKTQKTAWKSDSDSKEYGRAQIPQSKLLDGRPMAGGSFALGTRHRMPSRIDPRFARLSSGLAMMWSFGACKGDRRATSERASSINPVYHVRSTDPAVCDPIDSRCLRVGSRSERNSWVSMARLGTGGTHAGNPSQRGAWAKSVSSRRRHPWPGGGGRRTMCRRVWSIREEV